MIVLALVAALFALAWIAAFVLPPLVAPGLEAATVALHRRLDRGEGQLGRVLPKSWAAQAGEIPLIAALALALIAGTWAFFALLEDVVMGDPIVGLDKAVYAALQRLRDPAFDTVLVAITELGDSKVVMPVAAAGLAALLVMRRWRAALFVLIATAGAAAFVGGVKGVIQRPRPVQIYDGLVQYSFPSGHASMSIVLYGTLAFLLAYGAPVTWRRRVAFLALALVALIAFSRVYLGAHWLSDVLAGLAFGMAWVALLAMIYVRGRPAPVPASAFAGLLLVAIVAAGAVHMVNDLAKETGRYAIPADLRPKAP